MFFFYFSCLMIIGELTAKVRILLEKGLSRYNISKDQQFLENTQKFLFCKKTEVARRTGYTGHSFAPAAMWNLHTTQPSTLPQLTVRLSILPVCCKQRIKRIEW
jgi:hypothetical protein